MTVNRINMLDFYDSNVSIQLSLSTSVSRDGAELKFRDFKSTELYCRIN